MKTQLLNILTLKLRFENLKVKVKGLNKRRLTLEVVVLSLKKNLHKAFEAILDDKLSRETEEKSKKIRVN